METNCHLKLGPCCLHTHSLSVLPILCSKNCDDILKELFDDYCLLDYYPPGKLLAKQIKKHKNLFLENHGLFVSRGSLTECLEATTKINKKCKRFLSDRASKKKFLFPDAFVLQEDNELYHSYVENVAKSSGLVLSYLTPQEVEFLGKMEEEKYRRGKK